LTPQRLYAKPLEMGDQLLALREQPSFGQDPRSDAALDALDQGAVFPPDLVVERDQLVDPGLVHVRSEEVVQEPGGPLRAERQHRAAGEVGPAGEDVDPEVRPEEM